MSIFRLGGRGVRSARARKILRAIDETPSTIATIGARTGYDFVMLVTVLRDLRDAGAVVMSADGRWSLATPPERP